MASLAATVPATTTSWTDAAHADAQHSYTVTAVYGVGESAPSAAATFTTGISSAVVDAATVTARYNVAGQRMDKASAWCGHREDDRRHSEKDSKEIKVIK